MLQKSSWKIERYCVKFTLISQVPGYAYMEVDTTTYLSIRKVLKVTKIQCFRNVPFQNRLRQWTKRCVSCFK